MLTVYFDMNVGFPAPSQDESGRLNSFMYENVGFPLANIGESGKSTNYLYESVENRPAGSEEDITPTMN